MARLPIPGSDDGTWGSILNDYLAISHKTDGTIKDDAINASNVQDGSLTGAQLQDSTIPPDKIDAIDSPANGELLAYSSGQFEWVPSSGGGVSDGDKGDITVSSAGTAWAIDNNAVTYAKIQDVSATSRILGRATAGAGDIEELTPASAKTVLALVKGDVGLGNVDNTSDADKPVSTAVQAALDAKQGLDADLTAIAGLSPTNDDIIQRKSGAWTNRTPAQLKTDLALTSTDVGLGNVPNVDARARSTHTGTQVAATISDFDTEVSNNTDVAANTAARHTHSNMAVLNATTASFTTADETKLDGIEAGADVTDATNVDAAGAVMNADTSTAAMSFVVDEDNMASDSATKVPTQQSVKAYVDASVTGGTVPDGDKGDITVSGSGTAWAIDPNVVTYAKMQDVSATSRILGRATAGAGDIEELTAASAKTVLALNNVDNTSDANKPVSTATQTALNLKADLSNTMTLSGAQTVTGLKTWSIPKTQVGIIIDRSIADDVTSTDSDMFQMFFGPNGTGSQRSAWFNEWGAFRVAVPSTHGSETPVKIKPGSNASGYALAIGTSSDINDTQGGFRSNADLNAKATNVTTLTATGTIQGASVVSTGTVTGTNIGVKVSSGTTAPSSPQVGDVWVDTN